MRDWIYDHLVAVYLTCLALALVSAIGLVLTLSKISCEATATRMGVNYYYSLATSCMIEIEPDKWIPLDSYYWKEQK